MKDWFLNILRDPQTGETLVCDPDRQRLDSGTNSYRICDDVPLFVDDKPKHEHPFDYVKHYTTDAELFDYFEEESDKLMSCHLERLRETVMRMVPKSAALLLDAGCGSAFVAGRFCRQGVRVVSMDIAKANACKALSKYPVENHAALVADAYALPFADQTFDCIMASEIIEHTVDPQGFLASLLQKLKSGGTLVVSTPYRERIAYSLCIHCNCKTPHNAHLHSFDKEKVRKMLAPLPAHVEKMRLVGNKALLRSHLTLLFSKMGYPVWSFVDRVANKLVPKAEHFVIVIKKK